MAQNNKLMIVGGVALLFLVMVYYAWGSNVIKPDIALGGKLLQCTANVDSDYFSGADINSASCINTGESCIVGLSTMSIFGIDAKVRLDIDGKTYATSQTIETSNIQSTNAVLKACVPQNKISGILLLVNPDGGIEDTWEVTL